MIRRMEARDSERQCAAEIVSECITDGRSAGWQCYDNNFFDEVVRICRAHGVEYICDFNGEFAPVETITRYSVWAVIHKMERAWKKDDLGNKTKEELSNLLGDVYDSLCEMVK